MLALDRGWHGFDVVTLCADDTAHPGATLEWYPQKFGSLPPSVDSRRYASNPRASVYDNRRAFELLGWRPTSDFLSIRPARDER